VVVPRGRELGADFERERRWILLATIGALIAGSIRIIIGTRLAARRSANECPAPIELGPVGASLGFGAMSCEGIVAIGVIVINRYHRALLRAATRDHVTGAYDRPAFGSTAGEAAGTARRRGEQLSVVLFDVDDFERYNDTHGHIAGDAAAGAVVRRSDVVGGWRGDELVVLLPTCGAPAARRIAADAAARVRASDLQQAGMPAGVSISAGVAELGPDDSLSNLIARADAAMYDTRSDREFDHRSWSSGSSSRD